MRETPGLDTSMRHGKPSMWRGHSNPTGQTTVLRRLPGGHPAEALHTTASDRLFHF